MLGKGGVLYKKEDDDKLFCRLCEVAGLAKTWFKSGNGNSNIKSHFQAHHQGVVRELASAVLDDKQTTLNFKKKPVITEEMKRKAREAQVRMMVRGNLSLRSMGKLELREIVSAASGGVVSVEEAKEVLGNRKAVRKVALDMHRQYEEKVKVKLAGALAVHLTMDEWTSGHQRKGYACVAGHALFPDGTMELITLQIVQLSQAGLEALTEEAVRKPGGSEVEEMEVEEGDDDDLWADSEDKDEDEDEDESVEDEEGRRRGRRGEDASLCQSVNADLLSGILRKVQTKFRIDPIVVTGITTDTTSLMPATAKAAGLQHFPCALHVLALAVDDAFKELDVTNTETDVTTNPLVTPYRDLVRWFSQSNKLSTGLEEAIARYNEDAEEKLPFKRLIKANDTRWSSRYTMLRRILEAVEPLRAVLFEVTNNKKEYSLPARAKAQSFLDHALSASQLALVMFAVNCLEEASVLCTDLQARTDSTETLSLVLHGAMLLRTHVTRLEASLPKREQVEALMEAQEGTVGGANQLGEEDEWIADWTIENIRMASDFAYALRKAVQSRFATYMKENDVYMQAVFLDPRMLPENVTGVLQNNQTKALYRNACSAFDARVVSAYKETFKIETAEPKRYRHPGQKRPRSSGVESSSRGSSNPFKIAKTKSGRRGGMARAIMETQVQQASRRTASALTSSTQATNPRALSKQEIGSMLDEIKTELWTQQGRGESVTPAAFYKQWVDIIEEETPFVHETRRLHLKRTFALEALRVFVILATSVGPECTWSATGELISANRSLLKHDAVNALVMLKERLPTRLREE